MRILDPENLKTPLEIKTYQTVDKLRKALDAYETEEDVNAALNAHITMISYYASILSRHDLDVLGYADQVKSAMISYHTHVTKG